MMDNAHIGIAIVAGLDAIENLSRIDLSRSVANPKRAVDFGAVEVVNGDSAMRRRAAQAIAPDRVLIGCRRGHGRAIRRDIPDPHRQ